MRNKYLEAMFFMFIILFCSVGFANATEPVVTSDTVVNGTVSNDEEIKSVHNTEPPVVAFILAAALKAREDLEESPRKTVRNPVLVGADMSWAEYWSLPSDLCNYRFGWTSNEKRAAHFKSLIKTAGKRHSRRVMRRAAYRANRAQCKKRRTARAARGDVKTSKGYINRKSFWTSPSNRALAFELKSRGMGATIQDVITFKATLFVDVVKTSSKMVKTPVHERLGTVWPQPNDWQASFYNSTPTWVHKGAHSYYVIDKVEKVEKTLQVKFVPSGPSRYDEFYQDKAYSAEGCYYNSWSQAFDSFSSDNSDSQQWASDELVPTAPQPQNTEMEIEVPETVEETKSLLNKAVKVIAPVALGLIASLFVDPDSTGDAVSMASMITMSFKEYWNMSFDNDNTDYDAMKEVAEKVLPPLEDIERPEGLGRADKRKFKTALQTLKSDSVSTKAWCHQAAVLIDMLGVTTEVEVVPVKTLVDQFNEITSEDNDLQARVACDAMRDFIANIKDDDYKSIAMIAEYLFALESKHSYGNPRWKSVDEMLLDQSQKNDLDKLLALTHIILDGYRPQDAGNVFLRVAKDEQGKLTDAIRSSLAADYVLTIKAYPSNDKTLKGDSKGHGRIPKIAVTADIAWMSGYNALINQYREWCRETNILNEQLDIAFGDVVFVQNLKDASGNEVEIKTLNEAIMSLGDRGYEAVTPGFWVKRGHKFGDWIRDIFYSNKEVRARARSMATTPSQQSLHVDKAGKSTLVVAADLTRNGQPGADGANLVSRNYRLRWNGWIGQLRLHTNYHSIVTKAAQCKGLIRRHKVWAVHTGSDSVLELRFDRDDLIREIQRDKSKTDEQRNSEIARIKEQYLPCIVMDVQNIKGRSSSEIKDRCAKLARGEALCLNTWSLEGNNSGLDMNTVPFEDKLQVGRLFGGILAEDYAGKSSTSWQQYQLFSPHILRGLVESKNGEFRLDVRRQLEKLYGRTSTVVGTLFSCLNTEEERVRAQAAAMAQRGMSQRTVEAFVFGMKQRWDTNYCDQIDMPSGWFITANRTCRDGDDKYLAATGQPQLYHQCILRNRVMDHYDVRNILKTLRGFINDGTGLTGLTKSQEEYLKDFGAYLGDKHLTARGTAEEILDRLSFVAGSFGRKGEDTLVWISKLDQDKMQRDSDGDRVLFSARPRDVKLAKLHNEAIKNLPVPKIEVGDVGQDGDGKYLAMVEGEWAKPGATYQERLDANSYICAPNQGQGPTGQLVNQASALLNFILWEEENGSWAPTSAKRKAALQLYAFICLLIQNAIDRTKKPHAVPTLSQCFELDLYSGVATSYEIEGGEGNPRLGSEKWPAMRWESAHSYQTRKSFTEQYNVPVLKHWLSWSINMINNIDQNLLFDDKRSWIDIIGKVSAIFASNTDRRLAEETSEQYVQRLDAVWKTVATALGRDEADFDEIRETWVWPQELYEFKNQASLEVPLQRAAPGLMTVSKMVVEEDRAAKAKYSLYGNTMRELFIAIEKVKAISIEKNPSCFWKTNNYGNVPQLNLFISMFHAEIKRNRSGERREKGQSELMGNQKLSDTAEYLKEMKEAMATGEFDFPAARVLNRAFNAKVAQRTAAVSDAICMLAYATSIGYVQWAAANDVMMCWGYQAYNGAYSDLIWGENAEESAGLENTAKGQLIRLLTEEKVPFSQEKQKEVLTFLKDLWMGKVLEHHCPWHKLYAAAIDSKNNNKDGTPYSAIWSEWVPALEEHLSLAESADKTREYFVSGSNAKEAIQYLLDGTSGTLKTQVNTKEEYIQKCLLHGFEIEIKAWADRMVTMDLSVRPEIEKYRDWLIERDADGQFVNGSVKDVMLGLYGLARNLKIAGDYRTILNIAKPIIQARRIRAWLDTAFVHLSEEDRNSMARSALLNETVIQRAAPHHPNGVEYVEYVSLKGRPEVTVPTYLQADFFQGLLNKGLSFYALAPAASIWLNFNKDGKLKANNPVGKKLASKWVYYDARMRSDLGNGPDVYKVVSLRDEFNADFAVGDIFSRAELRTWKAMLTAEAEQASANQELQYIVPKIRGMLGIVERKLDDSSKYYVIWSAKNAYIQSLNEAEELKTKFLYNEVVTPLHWGGNNKSAIVASNRYVTTTRTSAHRPIWRAIFGSMGSEGFSPEKGEAYNFLSGSKLQWGQGSKKAMDQEEARKGAFFANGNVNVNFYDRGKQTYTPGLREFLPFTTPGVHKRVVNGIATWVKVPRSPMSEYWGSIVIVYDDGTCEHAYCDDDAVDAVLSEESAFLQSWILNSRDDFAHDLFSLRYLALQNYCRHEITKVNGIDAPWKVAQRVAFDPDLDSKVPGMTPAIKAELVLGLRHITAGWDSYVLQKWDLSTQSRMQGRGTTAFKNFMRHVGGSSANFDVILPENADKLLATDLFIDPKSYI